MYEHYVTSDTQSAGFSSLSQLVGLAHAQVCCTGYCATLINGAVHSSILNQLTHSASQTVAKKIVVSVLVWDL